MFALMGYMGTLLARMSTGADDGIAVSQTINKFDNDEFNRISLSDFTFYPSYEIRLSDYL